MREEIARALHDHHKFILLGGPKRKCYGWDLYRDKDDLCMRYPWYLMADVVLAVIERSETSVTVTDEERKMILDRRFNEKKEIMKMKDCESAEYKYGRWAGNNIGQAQDKLRCVQSVFSGGSYISSQCRKKRTVGFYCKQHSPKEPQ